MGRGPVTPVPAWKVIAATSYGAAGPTDPIDTTGADLLVVYSASVGPGPELYPIATATVGA